MCPQRKVIRFKQTHQPNTASFSNTSLPLFGRFLKKIYDEVKTRNVLHFHKVTKLPPCNPSIVDKSTILQFLFSLLTDSNYGPLRRVCVCVCKRLFPVEGSASIGFILEPHTDIQSVV